MLAQLTNQESPSRAYSSSARLRLRTAFDLMTHGEPEDKLHYVQLQPRAQNRTAPTDCSPKHFAHMGSIRLPV